MPEVYVAENEVVRHYAGSHAYGTNIESSDVDIRGIYCGTRELICSPFNNTGELTLENEEDGKLYELSKFVELYTGGNPNILETLWVDPEDLISYNPFVYGRMLEDRETLLSSKVAFTFSGYAVSQLKRIKGHNKWLTNPQPEESPKHKDFLKMVQNFTPDKLFNRNFSTQDLVNMDIVHYGGDIYGVVSRGEGSRALDKVSYDFNVSAKQSEGNTSKEKPMYIIKYMHDEYLLAKRKHKDYWAWVENRNDKRAVLEADHGYDTKHAMHLVRLLRMGREILEGQGVIVKRPDAQELLDIRNGAWDYDDLVKWAESEDKYIREVLYKKTSLPKKPQIKVAEKLIIDIQDYYWGQARNK